MAEETIGKKKAVADSKEHPAEQQKAKSADPRGQRPQRLENAAQEHAFLDRQP